MSKNQSEEKLTEKQVFDVINFAQQVIGNNPTFGLGVYTPELVNSTLKQLNVNTSEPNDGALRQALGKPNENEDELVSYSEWFNNNSMMYRNANNYLANMLAFDLTLECTNAKGKDYNSKEYKEDLERIYKFLDRLNYKREFAKLVKNMLRQETVYTVFRDDTVDYAIQQLPSNFCKIVGYTPYTMLFDFNMYYFLKAGVDIDNFPPIMKQYYIDVMESNGDGHYIPSNALTNRDGQFVMWHQTSPDDNFWTWKFSPEIFTKIPHLAPMMPDIRNTNLMRDLQKNKNLASARALVMGEIGFLENTKSGQVPDQLNLSPTTLATFINLVKAGLEEVWSIGGAPLTNLQKFQYEDFNKDMYSSQIKDAAGQGVSASRLLYATDKMSQAEIILALQTDGNLMKSLYRQFEDFLYFFANKKTRKFKFMFHFEGIEYNEDRADRLDIAMELADRGIVLPQKIGAAMGIAPQTMARMLDEAAHNKFTEQLVSLQSIHTANNIVQGGTTKMGRPRKKSGRIRTQSRDYDNTNET